MERDALRLECLKLAVGKTTDHQEALIRAEEFFAFVKNSGSKQPDAQKHSDNVKP